MLTWLTLKELVLTILEYLRWPSTPSNTYSPWYVIGTRLLLAPLLFLLILLTYVLLLVGWGKVSADQYLYQVRGS